MPGTIVVADDEDYILDVIAAVLEDEGHRVLRAHDGATALALIEQERPDLVLTDNMMPYLSGVDLIAHLHAYPDLAMPVVLMSAVAPAPPPPPPTIFLPKPFDLDDLVALVADLLPSVSPP